MPRPQSDKAALAWTDPPGLPKQDKKSAMRLATYTLPGAGEGNDGELSVFHFGAQGGGDVDANIKRWVGQFSGIGDADVKRTERTVHGLTQHLVEIEKGTFSSGMPGGPLTPKDGYGLVAAVVETPVGPYFFKATGPTETVNKVREDVFALLDSVKLR